MNLYTNIVWWLDGNASKHCDYHKDRTIVLSESSILFDASSGTRETDKVGSPAAFEHIVLSIDLEAGPKNKTNTFLGKVFAILQLGNP